MVLPQETPLLGSKTAISGLKMPGLSLLIGKNLLPERYTVELTLPPVAPHVGWGLQGVCRMCVAHGRP
jgi:hypothetical protein